MGCPHRGGRRKLADPDGWALDGAEVAQPNAQTIVVCVRHAQDYEGAEDGTPVRVRVFFAKPPADVQFSGTMSLPSGDLELSDPEFAELLPVSASQLEVSVVLQPIVHARSVDIYLDTRAHGAPRDN